MATLLGTVFSLLQYYLGMMRQQTYLVLFVPVFLMGIPLPIYVGYYRGGIKLRSTACALVERARGWIYLSSGLYGYLYSTAAYLIREIWPSSFAAAGLTIVLGLFPVLLAARIGSGFLSLFDECPSSRSMQVFKSTGLAAYFLGISISFSIGFPSNLLGTWDLLGLNNESWRCLGSIVIVAFPFYTAGAYELLAQGRILKGDVSRSARQEVAAGATCLVTIHSLVVRLLGTVVDFLPHLSVALLISATTVVLLSSVLWILIFKRFWQYQVSSRMARAKHGPLKQA